MSLGKTFLFVCIIMLLFISCDDIIDYQSEYEEHNLILIYAYQGNDFTLMDNNTLEIKQEVTLNTPSNFYSMGMCISTNNDYLLFVGKYLDDLEEEYHMVKYDISADSIEGIFSLGLKKIGYPKMIAAHIESEPGLIYLYSDEIGTSAIDLFQESCKRISSKKDFPKDFYYSSDLGWFIVNNYYPRTSYSFSYTELELFEIDSRLKNNNYVLNEKDVDSVVVKDMVYSKDNNKLYISYLLSQQKAIRQSAFFGSYDLILNELDTSKVIIPWSTNPYQIEYNAERNECYMVGESDILYVIDLDSSKYMIKDTVVLTGKTQGPSDMLVCPITNYILVTSIYDNTIYVIDSITKEIIKTITVGNPLQMFNI